nr:MAG TPA: hypothetical protein [Caudoviricetes sp.]
MHCYILLGLSIYFLYLFLKNFLMSLHRSFHFYSIINKIKSKQF